MIRTSFFLALVVPLLGLPLVACGDNAAKVPPKSAASLPKGDPGGNPEIAMDAHAELPPGVDASVQTPGVHVGDSLVRACGISRELAKSKFQYDSSDIAPEDKDLLAAVAKCITDGPLTGRAVSLTGRADPRGENEYNMALGEHRANAVSKYIHDLGAKTEQIKETSRGELDATGKDETGWSEDRRVDIELAE